MKNIMKKVIIVTILAMAVMMMCGFTSKTYREVPVELIEELINVGLTQNEEDPNLWELKETFTGDDFRTVEYDVWFDTSRNLGMETHIHHDDWEGDAIEIWLVVWDVDLNEFVEELYYEN